MRVYAQGGIVILFHIPESLLIVLDCTIDVPADNGLFASFVLVRCHVAEPTKLLLAVGALNELQRLHLLAPFESGCQLLLCSAHIAIIGSKELGEDDRGRHIISLLESDSPHLIVIGALQNFPESSGKLSAGRLFGRLSGGSGASIGLRLGGHGCRWEV